MGGCNSLHTSQTKWVSFALLVHLSCAHWLHERHLVMASRVFSKHTMHVKSSSLLFVFLFWQRLRCAFFFVILWSFLCFLAEKKIFVGAGCQQGGRLAPPFSVLGGWAYNNHTEHNYHPCIFSILSDLNIYIFRILYTRINKVILVFILLISGLFYRGRFNYI